jgi:hypothetical protein
MIQVNGFAGTKPLIPVERLPVEYAASASGCDFYDGELNARQTNKSIAATLVSGVVQSIFWYERAHWFSFNGDVDCVKSTIAQDDYSRIYYTGEGAPKVTANDIAVGVTSPNAGFDLGVPAPTNSISLTIPAPVDVDPDDFGDDETRFYVMTYVTSYGEEGSPSPVSLEITLTSPDDVVTLGLQVPVANTHNITRKRIYRTASSAGTVDMFFVAEVDIAVTELEDTLKEVELGYPLATVDFDVPPANMIGLTSMAGGFLAGFAGNEVCFSKPYLPYAYPESYRGVTEQNIVAIAATDSALVVLTEGFPYLFSGISPDAMVPRKLELRLGCQSKRSVVDMGDQVIYASKQGLVAVSSNGVKLLTQESLSKKQWLAFQPDTIHGYAFDQYYVGFYGDSAGFIYDLKTDSFMALDFYASAGYSDPLEDALYLVVEGSLYDFSNSGVLQSYRWLSKVVVGAQSFSCCLLDTENPDLVGFKLLVDGNVILDVAIGQLPVNRFKLPPFIGERVQFELTGTAKVKRLILGNDMRELR